MNAMREERGNIFDLSREDWHFAHCISLDAKIGAGVALHFKREFNLRLNLQEYVVGTACLQNKVFNLITKERYWGKPTYTSLTQALIDMRERALENSINKIAMPKIGCGLDKLEWEKVREIIKEIFDNTGIEILVIYL